MAESRRGRRWPQRDPSHPDGVVRKARVASTRGRAPGVPGAYTGVVDPCARRGRGRRDGIVTSGVPCGTARRGIARTPADEVTWSPRATSAGPGHVPSADVNAIDGRQAMRRAAAPRPSSVEFVVSDPRDVGIGNCADPERVRRARGAASTGGRARRLCGTSIESVAVPPPRRAGGRDDSRPWPSPLIADGTEASRNDRGDGARTQTGAGRARERQDGVSTPAAGRQSSSGGNAGGPRDLASRKGNRACAA
jgi:hypothetical protein